MPFLSLYLFFDGSRYFVPAAPGCKLSAIFACWRSILFNSLYSIEPDLSTSNSSKTLSISETSSKKSKPSAWIARRNSFLSMVPLSSSSHWRNRSTTRV